MNSVGKGRTAEVFRLDENRVIKLFYDESWKEAAENETAIMKTVNRLAVDAPACYGMTVHDGRIGIVYDYVAGKSLLGLINTNPLGIRAYACKMADLHLSLHAKQTDSLVCEQEYFRERLSWARDRLGRRYDQLLEELERKPSVNAVCHGDFHPDNILVGNGKSTTIDWNNSYAGTPAGDIARTCLMITSPFIPDTVPPLMRIILKALKQTFAEVYLKRYLTNSDVRAEDVRGWIRIAAAVRLSDNIPGEEEWLLGLVDGSARIPIRALRPPYRAKKSGADHV